MSSSRSRSRVAVAVAVVGAVAIAVAVAVAVSDVVERFGSRAHRLSFVMNVLATAPTALYFE